MTTLKYHWHSKKSFIKLLYSIIPVLCYIIFLYVMAFRNKFGGINKYHIINKKSKNQKKNLIVELWIERFLNCELV